MELTRKNHAKRFSIEDFLYLSAFLIALVLRFIQLGSEPLSDSEALWANSAHSLSQGSPNLENGLVIQPGLAPAYIVLTSILFSIFNDSEFTARFWPAMVGSLLVLAPLLLRKGNWGGINAFRRDPITQQDSLPDKRISSLFPAAGLILLSLGLAIDPGLVTVSRQAGGDMLALGFSVLALASWIGGWRYLAGGFAAIALLSDSSIIPGMIGIAFAASLVYSQPKPTNQQPGSGQSKSSQPSFWKDHVFGSQAFRQFALAATITFLVVGTGLFRYPQGIAAWLSSIQSYFLGWFQSTPAPFSEAGLILQPVPPFKLVLTLLVYELFPLIFFLIALVRSILRRKKIAPSLLLWVTFAFTWTGISLLLTLAYPGRQVSDLIWCVVPIWMIAALELSSVYPFRSVWTFHQEWDLDQDEILGESTFEKSNNSGRFVEAAPVAVVLGSFIFILLALFWFTLSALSLRNANEAIIDTAAFNNLRWLVPVGTLILIILTTALVSLGWSFKTGQQGFYWGITLALLIYNFSVLWGSAYLRANQPQEFWSHSPGAGQVWLIHQTLNSLSKKETGFTGYLDILSSVNTPSMRWLLRNYPQTQFVNEPRLGESPSVVITWADQEYPVLSAAYSGQDFTWWRWPGWEGAIPPNFLRWLNYRDAPQNNQKIILWARADLVQEPVEPILESGGEQQQNEEP